MSSQKKVAATIRSILESWLEWTKSKLLCFSSEAERGGGHETNCPRLKGAATIRSILESWLIGRKRLTANEVGVYSPSRVRIPHSPPIFTFCEIVRNYAHLNNPLPMLIPDTLVDIF